MTANFKLNFMNKTVFALKEGPCKTEREFEIRF